MSNEESLTSNDEKRSERNLLGISPKAAILVAAFVVLSITIFFVRWGKPIPKATNSSTSTSAQRATDDHLIAARDTLSREADFNACKTAIQQINSHLNQHPEQRPPALSTEELAMLRDRFGLKPEEITEAEGSAYTVLDAHYLDERLLFRDAARSLDAEETGTDSKILRPQPVERAAAAFRWVIRQLRPIENNPEPLPPVYALRRAKGSPLERALVFNALLEQDMGPERLRCCLLTIPTGDKNQTQLWACGVVVGNGEDVYLFDPRLGIPIPGPGGQGVATLSAVTKDPSILEQLNVGKDHHYDISTAQALTADGLAVYSLTALAPRIRYLQDTLLGHNSGVQLAADPTDVDRLQKAMKASNGRSVSIWKPGIGLLRRFLPKDEGGSDAGFQVMLRNLHGFTTSNDPSVAQMTRKQLFETTLVPWEAMPLDLRNPEIFPYSIGLGRHVRDFFAGPFMRPVRDSQGSRELLLHGRYTQAIPKLVTEDGEMREYLSRRAQMKDLSQDIKAWVQRARSAYVEQLRARGNAVEEAKANENIDHLWKESGPIAVLILGAAAGPRDEEITYQLGLCMQEQAEQQQSRLDLLTRAGLTPETIDIERCKQSWVDAKGWWDRFSTDYGHGISGPSARQNRGRAEAMLGDWQSAATTWEDLSGPMSTLEKVAALYRAREIRKEHASKK